MIRLIRFACTCTAGGLTIMNAAIRRCLSATRRHRAAAPSASSIHILRARKHPWDHVTGGIARSTSCLASSGSSNVCCWKKSGKHLLALSFSGFDPGCVKTCTSRECAELFSLFSSFDGDCQSGSFVIQRNRDKLSTRKFDVGVFTQPGSLADIAA